MPQGKLAQPASLDLENKLKNIINRACELEQRDTVDGEFLALKQAAPYSGGSIVAIIIISALVWKFWPRGRGPPLLINKKFFQVHHHKRYYLQRHTIRLPQGESLSCHTVRTKRGLKKAGPQA